MKLQSHPQTYRERGGYTTKAFTLIELLVVIAIIGILATVVIASLNSARTKGRHASIKANLRNAVSQSNIYFNENGTYTGLCSDSIIVSILSALGGTGSAACYVHANTINDIDWGIAATFDGTHFTADPSGVLQLDTANTGATQTWDTAMASCENIGKRMSGGSALKALRNITNAVPATMSSGGYWSSTEHPITATNSYRMNTSDGTIGGYVKTNLYSVRCGD